MAEEKTKAKTPDADKKKKIVAGPMVQNLGVIMRKAGIKAPSVKKGATHGRRKTDKV